MTKTVVTGLVLATALAGVGHAENASLGKIKGAKKVEHVEQKVTIGKDQIAFAGGVNSAAHNWNAVLAANEAKHVEQVVEVKGNQIAAAIGKDSRATNLNGVIAGDLQF